MNPRKVHFSFINILRFSCDSGLLLWQHRREILAVEEEQPSHCDPPETPDEVESHPVWSECWSLLRTAEASWLFPSDSS